MEDPDPSNISGEKRVSHSVNWEINVGHVALAVAVIYVIWKLLGSRSGEIEDAEDGETTIPVGGDGGLNSRLPAKR